MAVSPDPVTSKGSRDSWAAYARSVLVGQVVVGTVRRVYAYGAFVELAPEIQALVHRSQILPGEMVTVEKWLWPGDQVKAVIAQVDWTKRQISLSIADYLRLIRVSPTQATEESRPLKGTAQPARQDETLEREVALLYQGLQVQPQRIERVVLLEDADDLRETHRELLEMVGYSVFADKVVQDVPEFLEQEQADLYLIDAHMPGLDGLDLARALRKRRPSARIILISGLQPEVDEKQAFNEFDLHFLHKPFTPEDLDAILIRLENGEELDTILPADFVGQAEESSFVALPVEKGLDHRTTLRQILSGLVIDTQATAGAIFSLDLITHEVKLVADVNIPAQSYLQWRRDLDLSPVKDVIVQKKSLLESDALYRKSGKFRYLLTLLEFRSCIGLSLLHTGKFGYALFLFHEAPEVFDNRCVERARHAAWALNALIEREQIQSALEKSHNFTVLGEISAGLAHEVNNRVGALLAEFKLLESHNRRLLQLRNEPGQLAHGFVQKYLDNLSRITATVTSLKQTAYLFQQFVSPHQGVFCQPGDAIQKALRALEPFARKSHVELVDEVPPRLPLVALNDVALEQILINLILNAIQNLVDARRLDGKVQVKASHRVDLPERPVEFEVIDNGTGIHHKWWEAIFDLGFSTRPNGSGLGLFISRTLIRSFKGEIRIKESVILDGTTFQVTVLPYSLEG